MRKHRRLNLPDNIHSMPSKEALPIVARECGGRALVSFSGGKDSVGCVLALREHFDKLHLFHMYTVPGLRIVEETLTYYERLWGLRITRVPHFIFHKHLKEGVFQAWHRLPIIDWWDPQDFTYDEMCEWIMADLGWPAEAPMAVGIRYDDSIFRQASLRKTGCYNANRNTLYPIFDWSRADLRAKLIETQTRLGPEYRFCGRSFSGNGLDYRYIAPLKQHYPDDYERLRYWYPMLDAELMRYEFSRLRAERGRRSLKKFSL